MTDEEFEKELEDLMELFRDLRLIKDRGRKQWLRAVIRDLVSRLLRS